MKSRLCLIVLVFTIIVSSCAERGDPKLTQSVLADIEAYKQFLENGIRTLPSLHYEIATLSKSHRDLLATQGKKLSPEEHTQMVRTESAKLPDPAQPKRPLDLHPEGLIDEQSAAIEELTIECKRIEADMPPIMELRKQRQWINEDIARLKKNSKTAP